MRGPRALLGRLRSHWPRGLALLVLGAAAVLDRAPDGGVRVSVFPLALNLWDPFVLDCLRHGVATAAAVAAGSLLIGVAVASLTSRSRFRGRGALVALACGGIAIAPAFQAIAWRRLAHRYQASIGSLLSDSDVNTALFVIAELTWGATCVGLASARGLGRVDVRGLEALRLEGAGRFEAWRCCAWPAVRRDAVLAASAVFAWTLFEPGAPRVLNLTRTPAYQVVASILRRDAVESARAAALVLMAWGVVAAAHRCARLCAGREPDCAGTAGRAVERAFTRRDAVAAFVTALVAALVWGPTLAFLLDAGLGAVATSPRSAVRDLLVTRPIVNSLAIGALAVFGSAVAARLLRPRAWSERARGVPWPAVVVAAALLPHLARVLDAGDGSTSSRIAATIAAGLDVDRTPGVLLAVASTALAYAVCRPSASKQRDDAARVRRKTLLALGADPRYVRRLRRRVPWSRRALAYGVAAAAVAPGLMLSTSTLARPLAPAAVEAARRDERADADASLAVLIAAAVALQAAGLLAAAQDPESALDHRVVA